MTERSNHPDPSAWDQAVSRRLARLREAPVDTAGLERALAAEVARPRVVLRPWGRALRLAAVVAVVAGLGIVLAVVLNHSSPASADELAQVHANLVSGRAPTMPVATIADANRMLQASAQSGPGFPTVPASHIHACCVVNVADKQIACLLLQHEGVYVTLAIASAGSVRLEGPATVTGGRSFHIQHIGTVNMVTFEQQGRHICLMSELPAEKLMEIAGGLEF